MFWEQQRLDFDPALIRAKVPCVPGVLALFARDGSTIWIGSAETDLQARLLQLRSADADT